MELKIQIDETMFKDIIEKELAAFSQEELHEIIRGMIEESMRSQNYLRELFFRKEKKWYGSDEYNYVPGALLINASKTFDLSPAYKEIQDGFVNELKNNYKDVLHQVMLSMFVNGLTNTYDFHNAVRDSVMAIKMESSN